MKAKCDVSESAGSGTPAWPRCLAPHCQSLEYLLTLGNLDRRPGRRSGKKPSGPSRRRPQTRLYGVGRRVPWSQTRLEENESRELHYSVENTTDDSLCPRIEQNLTLVLIEPRKHPYMRAVLHNACQVRLLLSRCEAPLTARSPSRDAGVRGIWRASHNLSRHAEPRLRGGDHQVASRRGVISH